MKKNIFLILICTICLITFSGSLPVKNNYTTEDLVWSLWQESQIRGIDYRVAYHYFNEYASKQGKPAHVWVIQVRNSYTTKKGISWCVGDYGKSKEEINNPRRNSCMKSGEVYESGAHFTNTSRSGTISVHFWDLKDCNW